MAKTQRLKEKFKKEEEEKSFDKDFSCDEENNCKAKVTNETHGVCPNTPICPKPNIPVIGDVVVKIPVVLAETNITIPVVSIIKLEEKAIEIKRIRKNVFIKQCHLIPGSVTKKCPSTGILNIAGFVRKNIEYATKDCTGRGVISGRINHTTVDVPFSCTTRITFTVSPVFVPNFGPKEIETFQNALKSCDICEENIMGSNPCERNFSQTEFFNERVFCELVSATIFESDISTNSCSMGCKRPTELVFDEITEKMVVNVVIKLLQKQQVRIDSEEYDDDLEADEDWNDSY